ncbi:hypothetical protein EI74_0200 [Mycoplasma testudineum]|uniref:Uncharacterized protein n=1 Tax=Mycoplasma testudineum TaxID=244584 RepID=A0A4V3C391_9MOLU|nr:hypothetical protein [Mycoplasma testudineum]OYD27077.1 hypothetical protein CG473_00280 [Mycoplasma testudineum]TDO21169.1 hypothetical protein EI74_0200 [Mycoplasma testudineum]
MSATKKMLVAGMALGSIVVVGGAVGIGVIIAQRRSRVTTLTAEALRNYQEAVDKKVTDEIALMSKNQPATAVFTTIENGETKNISSTSANSLFNIDSIPRPSDTVTAVVIVNHVSATDVSIRIEFNINGSAAQVEGFVNTSILSFTGFNASA